MNFSYRISLFNVVAPMFFIFALYIAYGMEGGFFIPGFLLFFGIFIPILLLIIDFRFQYVIKSKRTILFLEALLLLIGGLLIYLYVQFLNIFN